MGAFAGSVSIGSLSRITLGSAPCLLQKFHILHQVGNVQRRNPALLRAHDVAGSAQLQVHLGDLETVVGAHHGAQTRAGIVAQLVAGHQDAVALLRTPPHPSAQLMQLAQPETFGVLDHHHAGIRYIHTHLDHRGGHQDVGFPLLEPRHLVVLRVLVHAAMHDAHRIRREGESAGDALESVGHVLQVQSSRCLRSRDRRCTPDVPWRSPSPGRRTPHCAMSR